MYLRLKAADRAALTAALKACGAGFVIQDATGADVIVEASHRHAIVHGLTFVATPAVRNEADEIVTPAVLADGYHADITGEAVTPAVQTVLEANGVTVLDPSTPQHVIG
jgi:hypothetical protein